MLPLLRVIEYLRSNGAPFLVASFPAPEPAPEVGYRRPLALQVDTHVVAVDGRPAIACVPHGERINLLGLRAGLGAELVEEAGPDILSWPFEEDEGEEHGADGSTPPLGRLLGATVFVDGSVLAAPIIEFAAFAPFDFIQMPFEDFARIEQPRVLDFVGAGELPASLVH